MIDLRKFVVGPLNTNLYLLVSGKEAVIIDPGDISGDLSGYLQTRDIKVKYVLATHGHFDHINGAGQVCRDLDCTLYINEKDAEMVRNNQSNMMQFMGILGTKIEDFKTYQDGQLFKFGEEKILAKATPGHTSGSTCFLGENVIFSGDTLFRETIGRTGIGGSNSDMITTLNKFKP